MKHTKIIILLLLLATAAQGRTRKVLFIGNSYIYSNDIPNMLKQLAASMGDTLIYDQSAPGGQTFQQHVSNPTTLNKIKAQKWDIVILQEQSQRPAFQPGQVATDVYPYARILDSLVRDNHACTETMFYMTWGRKNGDVDNCPFYPVICTYDGMQQRLRESYMEMAKDNKAVVAPVGAAWKLVRDSASSIELYSPDNSHPSMSGSYLAACVFYASIFHRSPVGSSYTGGVVATDAQKLQYFAAKVTMDSLNQWQQHGNYTTAGFKYTVAGNKATFQNTSAFATTYLWEFGDGSTSNVTNPTYNYPAKGKYAVKLTAKNNCFSETFTDSVSISMGNIKTSIPGDEQIRVATSGSGSVILFLPDAENYKELQVLSVNGGIISVHNAEHTRKITLNNLIPGLYIYKLTGDNNSLSGYFSVQ